ncbi:hypothetical protein IFM89_007933 [Coptis chinensis]|uniref:FBD domain-containing protein n=1 Tax=Coptis chinensis TaxID=261450 RepID=A0A835M7U1_9MAGN|nr:hypothetical protein IFM89_007933 [Coptis chinensis]
MTMLQSQFDNQSVSVGVERLIGLPLPLIYPIVSFLPVEEMVQTCVPSFHFDHDLYLSNKIRDFFKFVESVLFRRDGLDIQKFSLSLRYNSWSADSHRVNSWIIYALRHNVQVLHISNDNTSIAWTPQIFTCESLREFKLRNEYLKLPTLISLPVLTTLHLSSVEILNGHLHVAFFSACPCLETLILEECEFVNCYTLTISASQLKNLRISDVVLASIVISTPKLVSIEMIRIGNPSIRFTCELKFISDANFDTVRNAQSLTLSLLLQGKYTDDDDDIKGKYTDTLPENNGEDEDNDDNQVDKRKLVEEAWSLCKLSHLKLVEMQGFRGSQIEVKLVKFFLENAIVLERMIITVSKSDQWISIDKQGMMRIGRELLKHPRASSSVGILFLHDL